MRTRPSISSPPHSQATLKPAPVTMRKKVKKVSWGSSPSHLQGFVGLLDVLDPHLGSADKETNQRGGQKGNCTIYIIYLKSLSLNFCALFFFQNHVKTWTLLSRWPTRSAWSPTPPGPVPGPHRCSSADGSHPADDGTPAAADRGKESRSSSIIAVSNRSVGVSRWLTVILPASAFWSAGLRCWAEPPSLSPAAGRSVTSASTLSRSSGPSPAAGCRKTHSAKGGRRHC